LSINSPIIIRDRGTAEYLNTSIKTSQHQQWFRWRWLVLILVLVF